ncbi:MAG: hypothetical protein HZB26_21430 [Candidatus Hydrogenedentes bacterium]|nr:hypothetical protein [Candidatus Hydrogenedentota bacterium]
MLRLDRNSCDIYTDWLTLTAGAVTAVCVFYLGFSTSHLISVAFLIPDVILYCLPYALARLIGRRVPVQLQKQWVMTVSLVVIPGTLLVLVFASIMFGEEKLDRTIAHELASPTGVLVKTPDGSGIYTERTVDKIIEENPVAGTPWHLWILLQHWVKFDRSVYRWVVCFQVGGLACFWGYMTSWKRKLGVIRDSAGIE